MRLKPRNWDKFQHYGNRRPPWIKLHRSILDNRVFLCLPDASMALAPCLWLLASESQDTSFDADPEELAFRLRRDVEWIKNALKPLIDNGFFVECEQDASNTQAECLQDACLEREIEREKEKTSAEPASGSVVIHLESEKRKSPAPAEPEAPAKRKRATSTFVTVEKPDDVSQRVWDDYMLIRKAKKGPMTATVLAHVRSEAGKAGLSMEEAVAFTVNKNWLAFNAQWYENAIAKPSGQPKKRDPFEGMNLCIG